VPLVFSSLDPSVSRIPTSDRDFAVADEG